MQTKIIAMEFKTSWNVGMGQLQQSRVYRDLNLSTAGQLYKSYTLFFSFTDKL